MAKNFITFLDYTGQEITSLMNFADILRDAWRSKQLPQNLKGKSVALIWNAGGFRNRVSFELGVAAMGGVAVQIPGELDEGESIEDVTAYLNNWFDGIVARTRSHNHMLRLTDAAQVPVVNARTDFNHPCEILGDLTYTRAKLGRLENLKVAFVGEATNLCHPWLEAAVRLPIQVVQICPEGYGIDSKFFSELQQDAIGKMYVTHDLEEGLKNANVVYTDCWPRRKSQEEHEHIEKTFLPYQITAERLGQAADNVLFLPCPPVTRGEEVSADAMAYLGHHVYEAKEYLLHAQNAVLSTLL